MKNKKKKISDAVAIIHKEFVKGKPEMEELLAKEIFNLDIAAQIYHLRTDAGLSQRELAKRIRTTDTVISRLESADYNGHSLNMLRRIAAVLNKRIEIRFVSLDKKEAA